MRKQIDLAIVSIGLAMMAGVAQASEPTATEFPAKNEIQPPDNLPAPAKEAWIKRYSEQSQRVSRMGTTTPVTDLQQIPVRNTSFRTLEERAAKLEPYQRSLPAHLNHSAVPLADISRSSLAACSLQASVPVGTEIENGLSGNLRVFNCGKPGTVFLTESLLRTPNVVEISPAENVNARTLVGGVERGVIVTRLANAEGEGMSIMEWRSGAKTVTLHVNGNGSESLRFLQETAAAIPD